MKIIKALSIALIGLGIILLFTRQHGVGFFIMFGSLILVITYLVSAAKHLFQRKFYLGVGNLVAAFTLVTFASGVLYWPIYRIYFQVFLIISIALLFTIGIIKRKFDSKDINFISVILSILTVLNFVPFYLFTEYSQMKYMPNNLDSEEICDRLFRYMTEINKVERNDLIFRYIDLYRGNCSFSEFPMPKIKESGRNCRIKILQGDFELTKTTRITVSVDTLDNEFEQLHIIPGNNCIFEQSDEYAKIIPLSGDSVIVQLVIEDKNKNEWFLIGSKKYKIRVAP